MLTDAGGLAIAFVAATLATRPPTAKRTWGWGRAEVLGATAQAAILLAVGIFVVIEAVRRFFEPPEIVGGELVIFGIVGLLGNVASIVVLASGRTANLNMRAAFLEVLNDALGSVAVIVAALVIAFTGFQLADAIAAILIGLLIVPRAIMLLRDTTSVLLESTPPGLDLDSVREHILTVPHVQSVHDLHVSQIATGLPVLTAHVVVDEAQELTDAEWTMLLRRVLNEPPMQLAKGEFGGRVGIWRLIELFDGHGIKATIFTPGRICELYPQAVEAAAKSGHEIGDHLLLPSTAILATVC